MNPYLTTNLTTFDASRDALILALEEEDYNELEPDRTEEALDLYDQNRFREALPLLEKSTSVFAKIALLHYLDTYTNLLVFTPYTSQERLVNHIETEIDVIDQVMFDVTNGRTVNARELRWVAWWLAHHDQDHWDQWDIIAEEAWNSGDVWVARLWVGDIEVPDDERCAWLQRGCDKGDDECLWREYAESSHVPYVEKWRVQGLEYLRQSAAKGHVLAIRQQIVNGDVITDTNWKYLASLGLRHAYTTLEQRHRLVYNDPLTAACYVLRRKGIDPNCYLNNTITKKAQRLLDTIPQTICNVLTERLLVFGKCLPHDVIVEMAKNSMPDYIFDYEIEEGLKDLK